MVYGIYHKIGQIISPLRQMGVKNFHFHFNKLKKKKPSHHSLLDLVTNIKLRAEVPISHGASSCYIYLPLVLSSIHVILFI